MLTGSWECSSDVPLSGIGKISGTLKLQRITNKLLLLFVMYTPYISTTFHSSFINPCCCYMMKSIWLFKKIVQHTMLEPRPGICFPFEFKTS